MKDLQLIIDDEKCTRCGLCAKDCPVGVLSVKGDVPKVLPETASDCIECQHCLSVCPTGALSIFGVNPEKSIPLLQGTFPTSQQMQTLVRGRRSVRQYKDENIPKETIDGLLTDLAYAPTGCNARALNYLIVDDTTQMKKLREDIIETIESALKEGRKMPDFLVATVAAYRRNGADYLFRGAPHLLIVSATDRAACADQDIAISLTYFELLAQCAGLGTVWCGLLNFAAAAVPEIRDILGIENKTPFYSMMFGHPAVKYARTVQRDITDATRRFHYTD